MRRMSLSSSSSARLSRRAFVARTLGTTGALGLAPLTGLARGATVQGANDAVGVGVIGAGIRGEILIRATKSIPGTRMVGVADIYDGHFARSKEILGDGLVTTRDYRQLLDNKDIQAIVIVTPDHWHKQMALEAMAAGKDVYIEKPMTHSWEEGDAIIAAARKHQRIVQVGSQWASMPGNAKAIEIIKSGRLGKVTQINGAFNRNTATGAWYYPVPPDASPETIDWARFIGPAKKVPFDAERFFRWRLYWDYSGGLPTDLFVHLITATHTLMGVSMPSKVFGMGGVYRWKDREVPDQMSAVVDYPEGFTLNLASTANNAHASPPLTILGTEGALEFYANRLVVHHEPLLEYYTYSTNHFSAAQKDAFAAKHDLDRASMRPKATATQKPSPAEEIKVEGGDATVPHMAAFYDSVRTRKEPFENADMGHRCATVGHMINLSYRKGALARWDGRRVVV
jgi:predicted dehydrogenase